MNYYEILNVKKDATSAEIRKSYKALMKKYHPDIYDGDKKEAEARSMEINAAYDVLSNPETRARYDFELNNLNYDDNINSSNQTTTSRGNSTSNVQDDFNNIYNEFKNNMYSHYNPYTYDNYQRSKFRNTNSEAFYTNLYGKNIEKAENYVYSKLDKLDHWQKVILITLLILFMFISILISSIVFFKTKINFVDNSNNENHFEIPDFSNNTDVNPNDWLNQLQEIYPEYF
jgi:curved DNA-binding protein CbpA